MSLTEKTGFFAEYYLNLRNIPTINFDNEIEKIKTCANDLERVQFVENLNWLTERENDLKIELDFTGKNATIAAALKEHGNQVFKAKKWLEAMIFYTKSYLALPPECVTEQAIILANRSATLYHMQKYDGCLIDVKRSMDLGYPKDLIYKLYERQARCYMAKKDYPNTIKAFKFVQSQYMRRLYDKYQDLASTKFAVYFRQQKENE